jgi:hypothetical protein
MKKIEEPIIVKKQCKKCEDSKPLNEFPVNKNYKDNHTNVCLKCTNEKYNVSYKRTVLEKLDIIIDQQNDILSKM